MNMNICYAMSPTGLFESTDNNATIFNTGLAQEEPGTLSCWDPFDPFGAEDCMILSIAVIAIVVIGIALFVYCCIVKPKLDKIKTDKEMSEKRGLKQQQISGQLDKDGAFNEALNNAHNTSSKQKLSQVSTPDSDGDNINGIGDTQKQAINRVHSLDIDSGGDELEMGYKKYTMTVDDDYDARSYHESDDEVLNNDDEKEMEYVTPGGPTPQ